MVESSSHTLDAELMTLELGWQGDLVEAVSVVNLVLSQT
jgi:hypothetical protein